MEFKSPEEMSRDEQFYFFKSQGLSDDEANTSITLFEKGLITTKQPGGSSVSMTTHDDAADQDKVRVKEGKAKTVPASESNKSDAMMDDEGDDDEDEDGVPDDEEYEDAPPPARKGGRAAKSFGPDEYSDEFTDALSKSAGPEVIRQFDASVAMDAMRTTQLDLYGQLAFETYSLKSQVAELMTLVKSEMKGIRGKVVESHNKQVTFMNDTIAKAIVAANGEIATIAKSLGDQPSAGAPTGVIAQVAVGGGEALEKGLPIALRRESLTDDKQVVSELLHKSLAVETLREDASAALSKLDRVKDYGQLEHFLATRNPALFAK